MALTTRLDAFLILKVGHAEVENIACAVVTMKPQACLNCREQFQRCSIYKILFNRKLSRHSIRNWETADSTSILRDGFYEQSLAYYFSHVSSSINPHSEAAPLSQNSYYHLEA